MAWIEKAIDWMARRAKSIGLGSDIVRRYRIDVCFVFCTGYRVSVAVLMLYRWKENFE